MYFSTASQATSFPPDAVVSVVVAAAAAAAAAVMMGRLVPSITRNSIYMLSGEDIMLMLMYY